MNTHKRLKLSVAISGIGFWAVCNSVVAQQQTPPELDITISVIEADESPAGFVNRLTLPPLDTLDSQPTTVTDTPEIDLAAEVESEVSEIVNVATEIGTDNIRETISIDGTTNVSVDGDVNVDLGGDSVISLPANIVDILDPTSPLQNTLQDTVDQLDGVLDTVVPSSDVTGGIVDSLSLPNSTLDEVSDAVVDITVEAELDAIVDNLEPMSSTDLDAAVQGIVEEQGALPFEDMPATANEMTLPLEDISDELLEVPLL